MNATLDASGIAARIPHAGPMCLLHRLDHWDREHLVCAARNHRDLAHPLRTRSGLLSSCAIEYAAQAMALHGALCGQADGHPATPGYLASARAVTLHVPRFDDLVTPPGGIDELRVEAWRHAGDAQQILYRFRVSHAEVTLAEGRAAVVLNNPLPT